MIKETFITLTEDELEEAILQYVNINRVTPYSDIKELSIVNGSLIEKIIATGIRFKAVTGGCK